MYKNRRKNKCGNNKYSSQFKWIGDSGKQEKASRPPSFDHEDINNNCSSSRLLEIHR